MIFFYLRYFIIDAIKKSSCEKAIYSPGGISSRNHYCNCAYCSVLFYHFGFYLAVSWT